MPTPASRPTVKDVAVLAGVAPMTVSYAFNRPERVAGDTRRRVLEAAEQLGYRPHRTARALRSGRTGHLGVVVGEHLSYLFDDPQAAQLLAGVADVCVQEDLGIVLIPTRGDASDVDRVLSAAVDAYVLWTTVDDDPVLAAVAASGRPAVIQGGPAAPGIACVGPDDRAAAAAVAAPLLGGLERGAAPVVFSFPLDRRRSAGVRRGRDLPRDLDEVPFPVTRHRLAGYRDAVAAAGLDWDDVPVAVVERNRRALGGGAVRALLELVGAAEPLVVLAMSDELALGAQSVLAGAGRSARVAGWDASPEAAAAGIWSVSASMREQGRACARVALGMDDAAPLVPWSVAAPR